MESISYKTCSFIKKQVPELDLVQKRKLTNYIKMLVTRVYTMICCLEVFLKVSKAELFKDQRPCAHLRLFAGELSKTRSGSIKTSRLGRQLADVHTVDCLVG